MKDRQTEKILRGINMDKKELFERLSDMKATLEAGHEISCRDPELVKEVLKAVLGDLEAILSELE